jgi:catechol 2,3-dioxygenase-like lactoylglutathione lyase family enzyme
MRTTLLQSLFHVAIKSRDIEASRRFYVDVLGMALDERPAIVFPGLWLRSSAAGTDAIFHLYAEDAAREPDGSYARGTGAIDHVSIRASGYQAYCESFRAFKLPWRANIVPRIGLWQLFVYDPSGVLLELTFSAGGRDFGLSSVVETHSVLVAQRVEADLHIWEGLAHGFFLVNPDLPQSREVYAVIVRFFDKHLGI